jgi:hypothetical protein
VDSRIVPEATMPVSAGNVIVFISYRATHVAYRAIVVAHRAVVLCTVVGS